MNLDNIENIVIDSEVDSMNEKVTKNIVDYDNIENVICTDYVSSIYYRESSMNIYPNIIAEAKRSDYWMLLQNAIDNELKAIEDK